MSAIFDLNIELLHPHPDNPRKDLGDLTELADSIRKNGVLQNLTVVDDGDKMMSFTVIIGHRRLAAAKLAGLRSVPCVITELTPKEQVQTMLLENMQRSDLTVYEQAQGFQMMLDLGDTVEEIAEETGFSAATVRRRVKLLELDQEKFREATLRGGTLQDYIELDKIEDQTLKNNALDAIGTDNFRNVLKASIEEDKFKRRLAEWERDVAAFATKIEKKGKVDGNDVPMEYANNYHRWNQREKVKVPDDTDTVKYYYTISATDIYVYREKTEEEAPAETEEDRRRRLRKAAFDQRDQQLTDVSKRHYELRKEFVTNFRAVKKHAPEIMAEAVRALFSSDMYYELFCNIIGMDYDETMDEGELWETAKGTGKSVEALLLAAVYSNLDSEDMSYFRRRWNDGCCECHYTEDEGLNRLYDFLISLGYEMSDEEKAMKDGIHELFTTPVEVASE